MTPTPATLICPECGRPLVIRTNRTTGGEFYGCSGYTTGDCAHTQPIPEWVKMQRIGHPELRLFDEDGEP